MISKEKRIKNRKKVEEWVISYFLSPIDPSGANASYYKEKFKKMNNEEFDRFMEGFRTNFDENLRLTTIPYKTEIMNKNIKKTSKKMQIPLFELVAMPFITMDLNNVKWTRYAVPVGWTHLKKVQQMASKKNGMSIHAEKRDPLTGQVSRDDKNGRVSDMENIALIAANVGDSLIKEFMYPKSDNMEAKQAMNKLIKNEGRFSIKDIPTDKRKSVALNTLDVYFLAAGIKTDLINSSLALKSTVEGKKGPRDYGVIEK